MKNSPFVLLIVALAGALAGCSEDATGPETETVRGQVVGQSAPVVDEAQNMIGFLVEADVSGDLTGTATAELDVTSVDEDGTIHFTGGHTFLDADGEFLFRTSDEGITTASGEVYDELTIVEGAEGSLETNGTVDLQTGTLVLDYEGSIRR